MPIDLLTTVAWTREAPEIEVTHAPDWQTVEASIRALDGYIRDHLTLQPSSVYPETWLAIGGGGGRYLVTGSESGEIFPTLRDPGVPKAPAVLLQVGGQPGEYDRDQIVSLEVALKAALAYFEAGSFKCGVAWSHH
jgi:Immunity protein Imm1